MRYPVVLLFRYDKYSHNDAFINANEENIMGTVHITNKVADLNKLFNCNYHLLITLGGQCREYCDDVFSVIASRMKFRWVHYTELPSLSAINHSFSYCLVNNAIEDRIKTRPVYSIFTTCYKSYDKILRAYGSLKVQTMKDWEWVIVDDSPEDDHFLFLRKTFSTDCRVRLYRRDGNSGSIGDVKNEAVSLCRGKYALELDHDDEILPRVLEKTSNIFEKDSEVGFIYMDFTNIYENGNNFCYGNGVLCHGYASYYCQKYNGRWVYVYITPNVNNITLTHLTCCPNHPRIWRRTTLLELGNYSEMLPICDDYDILLRTAIGTKMVKIHELGYVQYMNEGNNNFSLIRNSEINRIGPYFISPQFYEMYNVNKVMKEKGAFEEREFPRVYSKIWEKPSSFEHKYCNQIVNVKYTSQYCILTVGALYHHIDYIRELYKDGNNDFILLDNVVKNEKLWEILDNNGLDRFKSYSLPNNTREVMLNYFKLMYKSCEQTYILEMEKTQENEFRI